MLTSNESSQTSSVPFCPRCRCLNCRAQRETQEPVTVRIYDHEFSNEYTEFTTHREVDGSFSLTKLSAECGTPSLHPFLLFDRTFHKLQDPTCSVIFEYELDGLLGFSPSPHVLPFAEFLPCDDMVDRMVPFTVVVRWYPSPHNLNVFDQSVETFDSYCRLSLSAIARAHGARNAQLFDMHDENRSRYVTDHVRSLTAVEWAGMMQCGDFIAVTEAKAGVSLKLPLNSPSSSESSRTSMESQEKKNSRRNASFVTDSDKTLTKCSTMEPSDGGPRVVSVRGLDAETRFRPHGFISRLVNRLS